MVLVSYKLYTVLVSYKLNSAIERGTKPDEGSGQNDVKMHAKTESIGV